jgi:putative ATP-dependent endonuclease of OLD family
MDPRKQQGIEKMPAVKDLKGELRTIQPSTDPLPTGIRITTVRIKNFRCLRLVEIRLCDLTVLIGENNAGKSSFLEALHAAIGAGARSIHADDIFLDTAEAGAPREREVFVDLLLRPVSDDGSPLETFPQGSPWLELFGNAVQQGDDDNEFVAIRTHMRWDVIKGDYFVERRFLKNWPANVSEIDQAELMERVTQVTAAQLTPLSLYMLDAKRDAADDLRTRGSVWQRMVSDPGLSAEDIALIEAQLNDINSEIVAKSEVLSHVQHHLENVSGVLRCDAGGIAVTAVARQFRDLNKGMDVVLSTAGASQFPLARQGLGTRSLVTLLLFRAFVSWRQAKQVTEALHPFVAIEEPESHLHPQAQRAAFQQITAISGQKIISTHSPYVCAQASINGLVHFAKVGNETQVHQFDNADSPLSPQDIRKIKREVLNTRGELLFATCIVLFEGESEEQSLPEFATLYWKRHWHEMGITFIGVGGAGNYLPFLRLAKTFEIPWLIFSDGEAKAIADVEKALTTVGEAPVATNPHVVVLPDGKDLEKYICIAEAESVLREMIIEQIIESNGIPERGQEAIRTKWAQNGLAEILAEISSLKTTYAPRIPHALAKIENPLHHCPELIKALLDKAVPAAQQKGAGAP